MCLGPVLEALCHPSVSIPMSHSLDRALYYVLSRGLLAVSLDAWARPRPQRQPLGWGFLASLVPGRSDHHCLGTLLPPHSHTVSTCQRPSGPAGRLPGNRSTLKMVRFITEAFSI